MSIFRFPEWEKFCKKLYLAKTSNIELCCDLIYTSPVEYDRNAYIYLESKYNLQFRKIEEEIYSVLNANPHLRRYKEILLRDWNKESTWKQMIPFLVFAEILRLPENDVLHIGTALVICQAIPSTMIDEILDEDKFNGGTNNFMFSVISILLGLEKITSHPKSSELLSLLMKYTRLMYEEMWKESFQKFQIPKMSPDTISDYVNGRSRLISSVFFSITIEAAYCLSNQSIPFAIKYACEALRRVRQINDELLDFREDIMNGMITLPSLRMMEKDEPFFRYSVNQLWQKKEKGLLENIVDHGKINYVFKEVALDSFYFIKVAANNFKHNLSESDAFDLTLILNLRLSLLTRLEQNNWENVDEELLYSPNFIKNELRKLS